MNWLAAYEIESDAAASDLGEPATLTVILRDLDNDRRTFAFVPIEPVEAGDAQQDAIIRAMAGHYPDASWRTYDPEKQVASFIGRQHLYIVIYEEHDAEPRPAVERPRLFAV